MIRQYHFHSQKRFVISQCVNNDFTRSDFHIRPLFFHIIRKKTLQCELPMCKNACCRHFFDNRRFLYIFLSKFFCFAAFFSCSDFFTHIIKERINNRNEYKCKHRTHCQTAEQNNRKRTKHFRPLGA